MNRALQIASNVVVMSDSFGADVVSVTDNLYAELDARYDGFKGRLLISSHRFESDWPTWEVHPGGDEFVILLSGSAEMVLAVGDDRESVFLDTPGDFVIVPRGTWHTAKIDEPTEMLFMTPGEGTENRDRPPC